MIPDSSDRWHTIAPLLSQLLELDPTGQAALLEEVETTDPELREELDSLLRADRAMGVLDEDIARIADTLLSSTGEQDLQAGDQLGPFEVLRVVGSGGMGDVYAAERVDGEFEQMVALKVVRGAAGGAAARRFVNERRILAGLEHPNIARLLDGGLSRDDVPWFAMEYVEGEHLTGHCDGRRLDLEARLRLFLDVCDAVAYAHRNLVVHRDLKPANILVTLEGRVKLLDFGIARILEPEAGVASAVTMLPWLTPEYASPEQVTGGAVSTASDIYSMGVLLYELLCGQRPFQSVTGRPHLLARSILEDDPKPPSAALRGSRHATSPLPDAIAGNRSSTPQRLARRLRGDLDAIVMRALRREPDQRYHTADELAADIRRYLGGQPVLARRGSRWYAARRFVARNRAAVAAVCLPIVVAGLFGGFHTATVTRERDFARAEAERAERIADFLVDLFNYADPLGGGGGSRPVSEFLAVGAQRIGQDLADEPELRASMFRVIGRVYDNLGSSSDADSLFRAALSIRADRLPSDHLDLVQSVQDLGALRRREGRHAEADSLLADALRRLPASAPGDRRADLLDEIAEVRRQQGDPQAADSIVRQALDLRIRTLGRTHIRTAVSLSTLGVLARELGRTEEAEAYHRQALDIRIDHYGPDHAYVAESLRNLALALHAGGRLDEARRYYEEALELQVRVLGPTHPQVGPTRNSYGALLRTLGESEAALEQYRLVVELQRAAYGQSHPNLAASLTNAAVVFRDLGDMEQANRLAREGLAMRIQLLGEDSPATAQSYNIIGVLARHERRFDEAEEALQRADRIYRTRFGPDHPSVAVNGTALASVALERGDIALAERRFGAALASFERAGTLDRLDAARAAVGMGRTLVAAGRPAEAEPWFTQALHVREASLPAGHDDIEEVRTELGKIAPPARTGG